MEHLRLLASAIAGRPLAVTAADPGQPTWTDGSTIHLDVAAQGQERVRMVAVQASLVAAGSLSPQVLRQLARRRALARRYLAVEGHRALAANDDVLPPMARSLVDRGVAASLADAGDSLRAARARGPVDDPPEAFGALDARRTLALLERAVPAPRPGPVPEIVTSTTGPALPELDDEDDGVDEADHLGDLVSSPVGGGGPIGRLLAKLLAPVRGRDGGGPPGADAPTRVSRTRPGAGHPLRVAPRPDGLAQDGPVATPQVGTTYPEWDVHRGRYREGWCTVVESDPPVDAAVPSSGDGAVLRRPLARLGVGRRPTRRRRHGDDVDIDAAVEATVELVAGGRLPDEVYVESVRRRRDLAVLVLLDVSGSAGEPGNAGRSVHDHQRTAAGELVAAVHDLGDRVALYGFRSRGRRAVQLLRVKAFDDPLGVASSRRLDALDPAAYTRLGAAIRHGTAILEARGGTPRRLLVVLSDGFAYDHGYEGTYGEADARRALVEARRRGVGCLCLSVGAGVDPAALRRVFGAAAHATVPGPEDLPRVIGPLFRAALRSAEAQRRRQDRTRRAGQLRARSADR